MSHSKLLIKIGERIREIREQKDLSQLDLAVLCEFEKASMSRLEAGKTNATVLTLYKVSRALDISVSDLLKD